VLVGIVVGLAAAGTYFVLEWAEAFLLQRVGGWEQPPFGLGERLFQFEPAAPRWWLLLLLPAAGGLLAGLVIWRIAPEAGGGGIDPVIDAYHNGGGKMRRRVPLAKLLASVFTLGTGGSGGREGPMAQIGAGFGAFVAARLKLSARERRLLLLAGMAGGISALFRTPLGAAIWALEVLYREDFESEGLFPCLVSSVTAYSVFTTIYDQGSLFYVSRTFHFDAAQLPFYVALGVACAPLGLLWIKMSALAEAGFGALRVPMWVKPAIGGLMVGGFCLLVPWAFASGYGWMQDALRTIDDPERRLPIGYEGFGLLLGVAVAKMLATSLTVGSGGSAGKFFPSLFIGGFIGGAFGQLFHQIAPDMVPQPAAFVLVGMGAFYCGVSHTPIASIILVSELFGSYDLLVPLMLSEMITLLLLRRWTLYKAQVQNAQQSPAHTAEFTVDVLEHLKVRDHYTAGRAAVTIPADMNLRAFLAHVSATADNFFVVHSPRTGELVGTVSLSNVRSVVADQEFLDIVLVGDAMWPIESLTPETDLRRALRAFLSSGYDHLPVIDPDQPAVVLGTLSQQQVFAAYNAEMLRRRLSGADASSSGIRTTSSGR
jgi:CIC family chloride channel protein